MNKAKIFIKTIFVEIWGDMKGSYNTLSKPSQLLNIFFYVMLIQIVTNKIFQLKITLALYVLLYLYKIISSGQYQKNLKEERNKELLSK